ncbi:VOC family protein [Lactobacillus sp. Sy-1]|uniref:VOC family protein n=1 Tax=Lactobacillus sp. Sy-1 TaxID=2109645 RepID=UPI001C5BE08A|nr:VOC family protein [Lactobacillus sp. Sy-1]MBW1605902.1 VOC family protein [Lactobacillus sp. Sy-1]
MFNIDHVDHFVLTVQDIEKSCQFYHEVLGMEVVEFANGNRRALRFGSMKINLHQTDHEFEPKAAVPTPGSGDFCLITKTAIKDVIATLKQKQIPIIEGPETKHGAMGPIESIYLRDPDNNLVEIANYKQ